MKSRKIGKPSRRGSTLVMAVIALTAVMGLALSYTVVSVRQQKASVAEEDDLQAFYLPRPL